MSNLRQVRKRLRAIGRSLRPFEQEAEALAQELEDELNPMDDQLYAIPGQRKPEVSKREVKRYNDLDELQGTADMAFSDIQSIRQDIDRALRPRKRAVRKVARRD